MGRIGGVLLALALLVSSGCNSIAGMCMTGPHPYAGVRSLAWNVKRARGPETVIVDVIDFPLSLGLDTALLPFTIFFAGNNPSCYGFTM